MKQPCSGLPGITVQGRGGHVGDCQIGPSLLSGTRCGSSARCGGQGAGGGQQAEGGSRLGGTLSALVRKVRSCPGSRAGEKWASQKTSGDVRG